MILQLRHSAGMALRFPATKTFIALYLLGMMGLFLAGSHYYVMVRLGSVLFMRTRSLIAPAIAHTFVDLNPLNFL